MQVDYLIIGQGISGTMLSWFLHKEGCSFLVIDDGNVRSSSRTAAGIINPVTGRRYAYTWMIDEVLPFARRTYTELGERFGQGFIKGLSVIDFFPSPQMRLAFTERIAEDDTYLHSYPAQNDFNPHFQYDFGCGEISPASLVHITPLLDRWRQQLEEWKAVRNEAFDSHMVQLLDDGVAYGDVTAKKIIFCDGVQGAENPWFSLLPYAPNKGEALLIDCPGLPYGHIFKKGLLLAPWTEPGHFWVGSNYQWSFEDDQPSEAFLKHARAVLDGWLRHPYTVLEHKAAVRPATLERRPFVGLHPQFGQVGILNGMGTKGSSLAPYFAHQLVQHLVHGLPITDEANVRRFTRILSRTS